jgi:hypothetical protein
MVTLNHNDRFAVSKGLLEFGRINDVGKKQSQQPSAMFALKFFNLCPPLYRDLLQFPTATSTKVRKSAAVTNGKVEGAADVCGRAA